MEYRRRNGVSPPGAIGEPSSTDVAVTVLTAVILLTVLLFVALL